MQVDHAQGHEWVRSTRLEFEEEKNKINTHLYVSYNIETNSVKEFGLYLFEYFPRIFSSSREKKKRGGGNSGVNKTCVRKLGPPI